MAHIPIWPGSSSFTAGDTAFGFYDSDTDFQTDAPLVASWCAQRLGYPLVDIELQDINLFTAFEEAVTEYGSQIYTFQIINFLGTVKGTPTASEAVPEDVGFNNILLDNYGSSLGINTNNNNNNPSSYGGTSDAAGRIYTASLAVKRGKQRYNLLTSDPGYATATVTFTGTPSVSESISLINVDGTKFTFTSTLSSSIGSASSAETITPYGTGSQNNIYNVLLDQFETGSTAVDAATSFMKVVQSGSGAESFFASISASVVTITQSVEGSGGDTIITESLSNATVTNFSGGSSGLSFEASGSQIQAGSKTIQIKKIYHYAPAAINRYFDPYAGTGTGIQSLMQTFGFGNFSPGVNFMLMPIYFDVLKLQAIEFNDQIRKSAYHFQIVDNRYLKLFPIPTRNKTLHFEYALKSTANNPIKNTATNLITDISNVPYTNPTYRHINEPGKQWIRKYTLALSKEILGGIRGKYQSLPIPGSDTTLDYTRLLSEASNEKTALIEELNKILEQTTRLEQLKRQNEEAQQTQETFYKVPYTIYIG